ncbi:calcium-binding protein [uncultured Tateyamaria sp.]|uniref:calcium-binding protein n=1 Tax=uncultured Tateyamaria sp. TaxID=455651 RepID=UPI0026324158|nr:hypothetical protein [uncultured Tateyamaria sp.]
MTRFFGGDGFDTIAAGDGDDTVFGGNGRDAVFLGNGNDVFNDNGQGGELGRDTVFGGDGDDTIEGGNGADTFVLNAVMSQDVIEDYEVGTDTLSFADALRGGRTDAQFIADFASVVGRNVVFEFAVGQSVTLNGVSSTSGLANDLDFF